MTWYTKLEHCFVERIPRSLEPGVLYISMEYATAAHCCACGCAEEVITPLTPTDWKMTFDGETISLWPSVGNWQLACRSHYVIESGQIIRADDWTERQVAAEQARDKAAKARYYGTVQEVGPGASSSARVQPGTMSHEGGPALPPPKAPERRPQGLWSSIRHILDWR
jgi:hypothetical protein